MQPSPKAVKDILIRKTAMQNAKWELPWAFLNCACALLVYLDLGRGSVMRFFSEDISVLWYIECMVGFVLGLNCFVHLVRYTWIRFYQQPVHVNSKQKKLFRILDTDVGFENKEPLPAGPPPARHSGADSFVLPSAHASPFSTSPLSTSSWTSANSSFGGSLSMSSSSWAYYAGPLQDKQVSSPEGTPSSTLAEPGSLRWRRTSAGSHRSANCSMSEWNVSDDRSLNLYLSKHEESDQSPLFGDSESLDVLSPLRVAVDATSPRGGPYQTATRSPQASHGDDSVSTTTFTGDSIWSKWSVEDRQLDRWVENLRKWISQTILARLASEVDSINSTLQRLGSSDLRVGEASQSTLRQVALSKGPQVPSLFALLPYLDLTANQEYLVQRIRELSKGGCMSEFRWNGGSSNYRGKPWGDYLPTDSAVVLHVLCTYLDSRLPPDPRFPDGKTFTSQYFRKTPDKPPLGKDALCIHQSVLCPPHYRVVVGEDIWDLPKGRNNLFYAILLFLHCIKTKHSGMLGRISLGLSGVNLLWVVDG